MPVLSSFMATGSYAHNNVTKRRGSVMNLQVDAKPELSARSLESAAAFRYGDLWGLSPSCTVDLT